MKLTLISSLLLGWCALMSPAADQPPTTASATNCFTISGMHCDGCARGLTAELKQTRGVATAAVTFSNKLAIVTYDTNRVSAAQLTQVIKTAGFEAKPIKP